MTTRTIVEVCSAATALVSSSFERWKLSARIGAAALCMAAAGCSGGIVDEALEDTAGDDTTLEAADDGEIGSLSQALRCVDGDGNPSNDANCPWRNRWSRLLPANGTDISHRMAPALCSSDQGWLTISVDQNNQYNVLQWHSVGAGRGPSWSVYGASRAWSSKPACTLREDVSVSSSVVVDGFIIAGKLRSGDGNNNKLFASPGRMAPGQLTQNPTFTSGFSLVDPAARAYTTGGLPGLASAVDESGNGAAVMAFMGDDNRTIFAHTRPLPYTSPGNPWSARITGPVLPSGWAVVGAPSIARLAITFQIIVHARHATLGDRLFETHFFYNGAPGNFSTGIGSPGASWTQLASVGAIADDPWITSAPGIGTTAYFRRLGTGANPVHQIMQTGDFPIGSKPVLAVRPDTGISFASAPAATAGRLFDQGTHVVNARTTGNQIFWIESMNDAFLGQ